MVLSIEMLCVCVSYRIFLDWGNWLILLKLTENDYEKYLFQMENFA